MEIRKNRLSERLAAIAAAPALETASLPNKRERKERVAERNAAYKIARLKLAGGARVKCVIKNITKKGAKVVLEGSFVLSPTAMVQIEQMGRRIDAVVVWQDGNEAGLSFPGTPSL